MTGPKRVDPNLQRRGEAVATPRTGKGMATAVDGRAAETSAMVRRRADVVYSTGIAQVPGATPTTTGGEDPSVSGISREVDHQGNFVNNLVLFLSSLYISCMTSAATMHRFINVRVTVHTTEILIFEGVKLSS